MKKSGYLIQLFNHFAVGCLALIWAAPVMAQPHSHPTEPVKPATQQNQPAVQPDQDVPQVEISSEQQKLIGVKTMKVSVMPMKKIIRTVGRVEVDESRQATINAKTEGWIEKLYVNTTGSYISKGQKIAEIYSPELLATQQEFLTALQWAKDAAANKSGT
ncbi:MAG: efflux RND transporter periplasmic adaptor subunit, partial [Smithella sp.]|nr:efflux RND transporter periplasmic adaptor subunit [Smithella sp.]